MPKIFFVSWISKLSGRFPLRVVLIVPFMLQIITVVGLVGYLSFSNGQKSINLVATELRNEITGRIEQHLFNYLKTAHLINQVNADLLRLGMLKITDPSTLEHHFWQQLQLFDSIGYISFANEQGRFIGAERREDHSVAIGEKKQDQFYFYTEDSEYLANSQGYRKDLTNTIKDYDPRTRNWYTKTKSAQNPIWSDIYPLLDAADLSLSVTQTVSANQPYYDKKSSFQGILGTDIYLSQLTEFLAGLRIGYTGETFIIERSGLIVASSTSEKPYYINPKNKEVERLDARNSQMPLIRHPTQYLIERFGDLSNINDREHLEFIVAGEREFLVVKPLQDERGIDWLIVVVIPQADFMAHINANTRMTIWLCLIALVVAIFISLSTSKWLVAPLLRLKSAAQKLADGQWGQPLPTERSDEIGTLAKSFKKMEKQLKELFDNLEHKVLERTAQLKQKNELIRQIFGRYLSDEIVTTLLETESGLSLGGERREITILASDIRGFTAQSNRLPPEKVIKIINLYLAAMADVITEYQGTIDEFMGDGILVLFGAPIAREDDTERAVACACAMQLAMKAVNEEIQVLGLSPLEMGIGVNTGEVVVGNIGSEKRTKYGIIGNEVNLTYRIESYTTGGQFFISEATFKKVRDIVCIANEKKVQPKGIKQAITIYEVGGIAGKYNLYLEKEKEVYCALSESILLQYTVIEGKHVSHQQFAGQIIQLSAKNALVCCDNTADKHFVPEPMSNIKINLQMPNQSKTSEDIYAKVLNQPAEEESGFYIRFTSKPTDIEAELDALYKANSGH
nr:adenylate/guanylate cyclase domain-containing protein [Candidatus Parabeggiatoa sp.]